MAIDLTAKNGLTARQAAEFFPSAKSGKPAHPSRVIRYILDGVPLGDGSRVYLEALRLGNQWITTAEAIQEFAEKLTPARAGREPGTAPASRRRAVERADRELAEAGI